MPTAISSTNTKGAKGTIGQMKKQVLDQLINAIVSKSFGLEKDISDASVGDIENYFGFDEDETDEMSENEISNLYDAMDRATKIADGITYSVQNMDELEAAVAFGDEYMVWHTAEDEVVCGYCGPLDNKIVSIDELGSLDAVPPAHVNCRCEVVTIGEHYGELKPVKYYHSIPTDYDGWDREINIITTRIEVDTPEE